MTGTILRRMHIAIAVVALPWLSACCGDECGEIKQEPEKIYVDKYETIPCKDCPKPKYVHHKAPPPPEKVIRVHRLFQPCPPQRVIDVQDPPDKQKVKYEYIDEGTCKKPCSAPKPCNPCG